MRPGRTGLVLPAPARAVEYDEPDPSPALSQVAETWPTGGRMIGVVMDPDGDLGYVAKLRDAPAGRGLLPLLSVPTTVISVTAWCNAPPPPRCP